MNRAATAGVLFFLWAYVHPAHAHQPSESYLRVRPTETDNAYAVRWDIALLDLEHAVGLDLDGNGAITWGEVKQRRQAIEHYSLAHLAIAAGGHSCGTRNSGLSIDEHGDGHYAVLDIEAACPKAAALEIRYSLLFELDPTHRALLVFEAGGSPATAMLSPEQRTFKASGQAASAFGVFTRFVAEGVRHIAIGYDHIAFIVLLLLPAGLTRQRVTVAPAASARSVTMDILKVVTAFTIAHSLTLGLAASGLVTPPARLVETTIAASVIVAALSNMWPRLHAHRWVLAFGFGLVHGFGFANVLGELDLRGAALALPLAAFNVGVEIGQLMIAAAVLPLLLILRHRAAYRRWVIPACSAAIAVLACYWLVDRLVA